jgi:glycogen synthase
MEFQSRQRLVAFCAFENALASLGGLGTITRYLPRVLEEGGEQMLLLTPCHSRHPVVAEALKKGRLTPMMSGARVAMGNFSSDLTLYRQEDSPVETYHLQMRGFFSAREDPYHYADPLRLVADALAFSCAVPFALRALGRTDHVLLHAHDWETGLVALSTKVAMLQGVLERAKTVLTLHNAFDAGLPASMAHHFLGRPVADQTVLRSAIPFLDGPLTTVSTPFARELRHDPLQQGCFAPHLQTVFSRNAPIGIENGLFGNTTGKETMKLMRYAKTGDHKALLAHKRHCHSELQPIVRRPNDARVIGALKGEKRRNVPLFLMSGRFDLGQKGFDVIVRAFSRLPRGSAKLVFSPSNPDSGSARDYAFFTDYVKKSEGDITIWPFRIPPREYRLLLQGASYLVMPSLYEPFGAATEGFLYGTPVIARATGGLWSQIASWSDCPVPEFYGRLFRRDPPGFPGATGILYRERYSRDDIDRQWRLLFQQSLAGRYKIPLYRSMVNAAQKALEKAIELYHQPTQYASVAAAGLLSLDRFDWKESAGRYAMVYDTACQCGW